MVITFNRIAAPLVLISVGLALAGCSSTSSATSSLATTISNGSTAAQTASFDLLLTAAGKTTSGVSNTALDDALKNLQGADSSLGQEQPTSELDEVATKALALARRAEDATRQAQEIVGTPDSSTRMKRLAAILHQTSVSLSKMESSLEARS